MTIVRSRPSESAKRSTQIKKTGHREASGDPPRVTSWQLAVGFRQPPRGAEALKRSAVLPPGGCKREAERHRCARASSGGGSRLPGRCELGGNEAGRAAATGPAWRTGRSCEISRKETGE